MSDTYLLLQARNPDDIVKEEEALAFADRLDVQRSQIVLCDVLTEELNEEKVLGHAAVLVGGSGEYSVLDDDDRIKRFVDFCGVLSTGDTPVFASCFGFQAFVLAMGGRVIKDVPNAEVGTYVLTRSSHATDDLVFGALPEQFTAQLGHQDKASVLPESLLNMASSICTEYQAFKVVNKPIYATQFHPELTWLDNRKRFARYMKIYGELFGVDEAPKRMDSHRPSPEANRLLGFFKTNVLGA